MSAIREDYVFIRNSLGIALNGFSGFASGVLIGSVEGIAGSFYIPKSIRDEVNNKNQIGYDLSSKNWSPHEFATNIGAFPARLLTKFGIEIYAISKIVENLAEGDLMPWGILAATNAWSLYRMVNPKIERENIGTRL